MEMIKRQLSMTYKTKQIPKIKCCFLKNIKNLINLIDFWQQGYQKKRSHDRNEREGTTVDPTDS